MISIIMSVYNVEKYLEKCLQSIFNQTYKDIEVIIINDGSTDTSVNIINSYRQKYSNIIYIEQMNKGLSEARNLGLSISKGEYILYIDSDDYIDPKMIELMVEKIQKDKSDMVIIGHTEFYDDIEGENRDVFLDVDDQHIYTGEEVSNMMLECKIMGVAWNKLYKKELILKDKLYFEKGRYTQDWYPTFKHISKLKKISFVNLPLYKYRLRSTSTTSKKNEKRLIDYNYAVCSILNYVKESNLNFNSNSINTFKVITLNRIISLYYSINLYSKSQLYNEFKKSEYNKNNLTLYELFSSKTINKRDKIYILAWKMKIYDYLIKLEGTIRKKKMEF